MSDKCVRCGEEGEDRRTLFMACFYAMNELKVPFDEVELQGAKFAKKTGMKRISEAINIQVPVFEESKSEPSIRAFYTLRVCKDCRASWMTAIEAWFNSSNELDSVDPEANIPIRENGACKMITREEWDRRKGQGR